MCSFIAEEVQEDVRCDFPDDMISHPLVDNRTTQPVVSPFWAEEHGGMMGEERGKMDMMSAKQERNRHRKVVLEASVYWIVCLAVYLGQYTSRWPPLA